MSATQSVNLSSQTKAQLDSILQATAASKELPAVSFGVTTAEGLVYFNAEGDRVLGEPDKGQINEDTVLQLYSQTKLITTIGILQLVDNGVLSLDDPACVEKYASELLELKVLDYDEDGKEVLTPRSAPITLRRLLTHTSGLAYPFTSPKLVKFQAQHQYPTSKQPDSGLKPYLLPLIAQPGEHWVYSVGIDWAGVILERSSGKSLEEYFSANIFKPVGATTLTFYATEDNISRLQQVQKRNADGTFSPSASLHDITPGVKYTQLSGGGGLLGTPKDYLRVLQAVLASKDGGGIISQKSFNELFTDTLPAGNETVYMDLARARIAGVQAFEPAVTVEELAKEFGHSVGLALTKVDGRNGRKGGSGQWGGAAKTGYWLDPKTGIAAMFSTQILTPGNVPEPTWEKVYAKLERTLYNGLA